jgi:Uma2 family endonuclease
LDDHAEPQPDLAVIQARGYRESLPGPEDVLFLIEVSDTTLAFDRNVKLPLYARFGIREAWLVDLAGKSIERHTEPTPDGYRLVRKATRGEPLGSAVLPMPFLPVDAMLS